MALSCKFTELALLFTLTMSWPDLRAAISERVKEEERLGENDVLRVKIPQHDAFCRTSFPLRIKLVARCDVTFNQKTPYFEKM